MKSLPSYLFLFLSLPAIAWTPIVSEANETVELTRAEVRSIFTFSKRQWTFEDGSILPITVVLFDAQSKEFKSFTKSVLKMNHSSYAEIIQSQEANGSIPRIERVGSDVQMREKVRKNRLAIGFMNNIVYLGTPYGLRKIKVADADGATPSE